MKQILTTCSFGWVDQHRFAQLSGDRNPVHVDPVAARRTLFGRPVVHGIHMLLRSLDAWLGACPPATAEAVVLRRLRGRFPNPTFLHEPVEISLRSQEDGQVKLEAHSNGACVLHLDLRWDQEGKPSERALPVPPEEDLAVEPRSLTLEEIEGRAGTLPLWGDLDAIATDFPDLARHVGPRQVAELLATTRLVGMDCPGLHSIFSAFELERCEPELAHDCLDYVVGRVVPRASLVRIDVASSGFQGRIDTFRRPQAAPPPRFSDVTLRVAPRAFSEQTALVVGGSRGIGAATAKLIAAGGGHAVATYHRGEQEALDLSLEVRAAGGRCDALHCDIANPGNAFEWLDGQGIVPTHLYYLASPKIFVKRQGGEYSDELYQRFVEAYVDGLRALLLACRQRRPEGVTVFYPSSVAVESPVAGLEEYADAKRAGEALCADFAQGDPGVRVHVARLPRIDTDQTTSLIRVPAANAMDVMLEELRAMKERMNG